MHCFRLLVCVAAMWFLPKLHLGDFETAFAIALEFSKYFQKFWVSLGVRTSELFLCFVAIVRVRAIVLTSLFSLFYVTGEFHRFLHRGRAEVFVMACTYSHSIR